jgi:hypothetical protein
MSFFVHMARLSFAPPNDQGARCANDNCNGARAGLGLRFRHDCRRPGLRAEPEALQRACDQSVLSACPWIEIRLHGREGRKARSRRGDGDPQGCEDRRRAVRPRRDRLFLEGRLAERTTDWYTQDRRGNVWYFGERTAELDARGRVTSREGSWRTGFRGAKPGIFMPAHPRVGLAFRQEFFKGHAEDHFRIVGLFSTMAGSHAKNALLTREWTPLEPGVIDHKLYVRGIGDVVEQTVEGGNERFELVSFRP